MWSRFISGFVLATLTLVSMPVPVLVQASVAQPHGPAAHDHSCCPKVKPRVEFVLASLAPGTMPCGNEHACCVKPAQNPPSLPVGKQVTPARADAMAKELAHFDPQVPSIALAAPHCRGSFDSYSLRSTVLRI